ncbi:hypothetical protein C0J52_25397, partial [Blattella germanica]
FLYNSYLPFKWSKPGPFARIINQCSSVEATGYSVNQLAYEKITFEKDSGAWTRKLNNRLWIKTQSLLSSSSFTSYDNDLGFDVGHANLIEEC